MQPFAPDIVAISDIELNSARWRQSGCLTCSCTFIARKPRPSITVRSPLCRCQKHPSKWSGICVIRKAHHTTRSPQGLPGLQVFFLLRRADDSTFHLIGLCRHTQCCRGELAAVRTKQKHSLILYNVYWRTFWDVIFLSYSKFLQIQTTLLRYDNPDDFGSRLSITERKRQSVSSMNIILELQTMWKRDGANNTLWGQCQCRQI